jgi:hypothetical protein
MPSAVERFITTPRLCMEIIEDSLPRMAHSGRTDLRITARAGLAQPQATDMRAYLEVTPGPPTALPEAIAGQPLTGALKVTERTQATGDFPEATELSLDADQARRAPVASAAAAAVSRADPLRMEHQGMQAPAVRTAADTLAVDMPAVVTAAADTAASAKCLVHTVSLIPEAFASGTLPSIYFAHGSLHDRCITSEADLTRCFCSVAKSNLQSCPSITRSEREKVHRAIAIRRYCKIARLVTPSKRR